MEQESRGRHAHACTHATRCHGTRSAICSTIISRRVHITRVRARARIDRAFPLAKGYLCSYPAKMLGRQFRGRICARRCSSRSIGYPRTSR